MRREGKLHLKPCLLANHHLGSMLQELIIKLPYMEKVDYITLHDIIFVMSNFYLALRDHYLCLHFLVIKPGVLYAALSVA